MAGALGGGDPGSGGAISTGGNGAGGAECSGADEDGDGIPESCDSCPGFDDDDLEVIEGNVQIKSAGELEALRGVGEIRNGSLTISSVENPNQEPETISIPSLEPLRCLKVVSGGLLIQYVSDLNDLNDLRSLESIKSLTLTGTTLKDLSRLSHLEELSAVWLGGNSELQNLDGLSGLKDVGSLNLQLNQKLENIDGLASVTSATEVMIWANSELKSVDGLRSLTAIEGSLLIYLNPDLTQLRELHGITMVGERLSITNNAMLPTCEAEALRDAIGVENIGGTISIAENAGTGGCAD